MTEAADPVASGYDAFYEAWGASPALRAIWRDHVTGPDFPEEFAHISFLTLPTLRALVAGLNLSEGQVLVDLACGAGGPGLFAATETGARLVGRDLSPVGVRRAMERVAGAGLRGRAEFAPGSFEDTGIADGTADAVMTVDALQYAPDKTKALMEMARILRPGGRLAFVAFELDAERVAGLPVWEDAVGDYRPVLERTGFEVLAYEQIPGWLDQVESGFGAVVAHRDVLVAEMGELAATATLLEASITLEVRPYLGHILAVATRT